MMMMMMMMTRMILNTTGKISELRWIQEMQYVFVRKGVIWSAGAGVRQDVAELEEPWTLYLGLWRALLLDPLGSGAPGRGRKRDAPARKPFAGSSLQSRVSTPSQGPNWRRPLYDALMQAVLDALGSLDLRYTSVPPSAQPENDVSLTSP